MSANQPDPERTYTIPPLRSVDPAEDTFFQLIEALGSGVCVIDHSDHLTYINPEGARILGRNRDSLIGRRLSEVVDRDTWLFIQQQNEKRTPTASLSYDIAIQRGDGAQRQLQITLPPGAGGTDADLVANFVDVTERRLEEQALKDTAAALAESERRYRELIDKSGAAMVIENRDGSFRFWTQNFLDTWGYTEEELRRQSVDTLVHPDDVQRVMQHHHDRFAGKEPPPRYEFRGLTKDGHTVHLVVVVAPVIENGEVVATRSLLWDISDHVNMAEQLRTHRDRLEELVDERTAALKTQYNDTLQAEAALRRSEKYYRSLFEHAHDAIIVFDPQTETILDANPRAAEVYGCQPETFIGRSLEEFTADVAVGKQRIRETMETHFHHQFESVQRRADGSKLYVSVKASVVDFDGKPAILTINHDITQRKRMELALADSEEKYRTVMQQSMDCIYLADLDSRRVIECNRAFSRLLGYGDGEVSRLSIYDVVAHSPRSIDSQINAIQQGKTSLGERLLRKKDGATVPVEVSAYPIQWKDKQVLCVVAKDISERKRTEEERERLQVQLHQAQKLEAVGTLAGGVAHDFNNLMTTVLGFSDLLMAEMDETDPKFDDLQQIRLAAKRSAEVTRQLLVFSRKQPVKMEPLDVNKSVEGLLKMVSRLIGEDVSIETQLDHQLSSVHADASNIDQVLMNLVVNARDAMPDGGTLKVQTETVRLTDADATYSPEARSGRWVRLTVADTGKGMDKKTIAHAFEPFYTTKDPGKGTGLGLSVVFGIVKQHGGWIDLTSEPDRGTTFEIYLPATRKRRSTHQAVRRSLAEKNGQGQRILLVEDEEGLRNFASKALTRSGYEVICAATIGEAREVFSKQGDTFDLLLTDVVLPDGNGVTLAEELKNTMPELRVLLASGYADERSRADVIQEKGFPFMPKPYRLADLIERVHGVLK